MNDYENLARAEAVLAAEQNGAYDTQFGISPEERALLTKATSDEPLSLADVTELRRINRIDLIDAAHRADRINLNPDDQEN